MADFVQADLLTLTFDDDSLDFVFTSGVLIHIPPSKIEIALQEIARCSRQYVWGYEYYAPEYTEIEYRGNQELLWKADFPSLYEKTVIALELVRERKVPYVESYNVDSMFLLEFPSCS